MAIRAASGLHRIRPFADAMLERLPTVFHPVTVLHVVARLVRGFCIDRLKTGSAAGQGEVRRLAILALHVHAVGAVALGHFHNVAQLGEPRRTRAYDPQLIARLCLAVFNRHFSLVYSLGVSATGAGAGAGC